MPDVVAVNGSLVRICARVVDKNPPVMLTDVVWSSTHALLVCVSVTEPAVIDRLLVEYAGTSIG